MTLWALSENQLARIQGFSNELPDSYRLRLRELGFEKAAEVICLRAAPFAGPKVFQIGDSVFSVAQDLAELVQLERSV